MSKKANIPVLTKLICYRGVQTKKHLNHIAYVEKWTDVKQERVVGAPMGQAGKRPHCEWAELDCPVLVMPEENPGLFGR